MANARHTLYTTPAATFTITPEMTIDQTCTICSRAMHKDARERHIALQIRLQRLFVAGLQERNDIRHRLLYNGIDKQQREQHKTAMDRAADRLFSSYAALRDRISV